MANHKSSGHAPKHTDITAARDRAGHTQQDMADVIDIPIGTLQNYEQDRRGKMEPSTFKYYLLKTGQFRVEGVRIARDETTASVLELRTDDGRLIKMNIRPAELARLPKKIQAAFAREGQSAMKPTS